jgi:CheY-like chemotaxis protein
MLYAEDDKVIRVNTCEVLESEGWTVDIAPDADEALRLIRESGSLYDVVVLDLRMPNPHDGEGVLERIREEKLPVPPVIVLSAYLESHVENKCRYLGASHLLNKPYEPADLSSLAGLAARGVPVSNTQVEFDDRLIDYMVRKREEALRSLLVAGCCEDVSPKGYSEPVVVIGRRWNSWYPSFFPVAGGAYAILGTAMDEENPKREGPKGRMPAAVIDPGFRCLDVLRCLGIPSEDLETCVITHNHPDHMAGIFELMAARHALGKRTRALCSNSCTDTLQGYAGFNLEVKALDGNPADIFKRYPSRGGWAGVRVKGFSTAHEEIGPHNSTMGLCITSEEGDDQAQLDVVGELVILGDTAYERPEHRDFLLKVICRPIVNTVVLHIGCSQLKQATGKHLYLKGTQELLHDIEAQLEVERRKGKLLVLLSEWGLEHATKEQIARVVSRDLPAFDDVSPILETARYLQKGLRKIRLVPADIGLTVGLHSGDIYLNEGIPIELDSLTLGVSEDGIRYAGNAKT